MNNLPDIILKDIEDIYVRENFFRIDKFFKKYPLFKAELYFFELNFVAAVANEKRPHGLKFKPLDIIQTSLIGSGSLTWNYDKFDLKNLDVTTTGPCTVRAFIGAYKED